MYRLRTGYAKLNKHLFKIGVKKSEICENYGRAPETAKHFLLECAAYSDNRNVMLQELIAQGATDFSMQSLLSAWLGIRPKQCGVMYRTTAVRAYKHQQSVHTFIRQLMALPFLPTTHIRDTFTSLQNRANTPQLRDLVAYMDRQWFNNGVIQIADWCIFKRSVRTNNDVEGWHSRLNSAAKHGGVPFYTLVPDLMKEAEVVDVSVRSDNLERDVHHRYTVLEQKIQTSWDSYMDGAMSTTHFLKVISRLYGPSDQPANDVLQQ
ncbi:unnamed protein product [Mytilus coruscus]|uniref:Reverse transcriptase zinc-binding domain-containing protein n=1 Tax=Mytilus coruscus TaxID=42192 RepID=A0A6J8AGX4_MYTCO|nr:unnamed protein product [Mytilus coruscus]